MPFEARSTVPANVPGAQGIIGYYRFTDIYFEWYACSAPLRRVDASDITHRHQALPNQEDVGPLKALLAYPALVHADCTVTRSGHKSDKKPAIMSWSASCAIVDGPTPNV